MRLIQELSAARSFGKMESGYGMILFLGSDGFGKVSKEQIEDTAIIYTSRAVFERDAVSTFKEYLEGMDDALDLHSLHANPEELDVKKPDITFSSMQRHKAFELFAMHYWIIDKF